jgi:hypothetical protein
VKQACEPHTVKHTEGLWSSARKTADGVSMSAEAKAVGQDREQGIAIAQWLDGASRSNAMLTGDLCTR